MTIDEAAIAELVEQSRSGDAEAFGRIFDHYHVAVYRYIVGRVGRPVAAEDLTQIVFVKALEALPRYESRCVPFGGCLFRLARNTVIDHLRTRREHRDLDSLAQQVDDGAALDTVVLVRQDLDAIARALDTLTPEQREAIELRFFAGLSAREAAVAMNGRLASDEASGSIGTPDRTLSARRRDRAKDSDIDAPLRLSSSLETVRRQTTRRQAGNVVSRGDSAMKRR